MCTNKGSLCQFPYMLRGEVNHFPNFHTRRIEYKEMEPLSLAKKIVPRRNGVAWMTIKASLCALGRFLEGRFFLSLMISQPFALASTKLWETSSNWFLLLLSEKKQHMKDVSPTCFRNVTAATGPARDTMVTLWKTTFEVWATSTTWESRPWKTAEGCATLPWVVTSSSSSSQNLMKTSVPSSTELVRRD